MYGTLRRGARNKFARLLRAHARYVGNARIAGRLYHLGAYPGAVSSNVDGEFVRGELYATSDPQWIIPALDDYEGPGFERVIAEAQLDSGERVQACVYVYHGTACGRRVLSGKWPRS